MEYEFICHEYDRPKAFSLDVAGGSEISRVSYEFIAIEKGKKIDFRFEFQPKGFLRLLEPCLKLFKRLIIRQEEKELEALRDYVTKNT